MNSKEQKKINWPWSIIFAAILVAIAACVYVLSHIYDPIIIAIIDVSPPFIIALFLAILLDPVVDWFQTKRFSRDFGVAIVGVSFLILFTLVGFFVVPKTASQAGDLVANFQKYTDDAKQQFNVLVVKEKPLLSRLHLPTTASGWFNKLSAQSEIAAKSGLSFLAGFLSTAISKILWVIIIPLSTLWILRDLDYLKAKIVHLTPEAYREKLITMSGAVGGIFIKYVRGMMTVALFYSFVMTLVLSGFRLEYALFIGAISGLFYMVPYIGVLIIMIASAFAVLVQPNHSLATAGILMGVIAFLSYVVFDLGITPRIVGRSVGVHPVISLISLALGARLFGVVGMVAAVPVAASLQVGLSLIFPRLKDKIETTKCQSIENKECDIPVAIDKQV